MLSKVLRLDYLLCPQIWNIGLEKVGGRPAKLNEEKGDRYLERETKKKRQRRHFLLEEQRENFVAAVRK